MRPLITATTAGVGNPIMSAAEDAVSATVTVTAILWPLLGVVVLVTIAAGVFLWRLRRSGT